jgi:ATP-dependent exoDNAse (exonuclease V) beta subunit
MTELADTAARLRALTDLQSTLLVEAAAGTGKTALMAGRVTMLLASGVAPANIAAITFTELAANELATRVHRFIDELLAGRNPPALAPALPDGLDPARRAALASAAGMLDDLTTTTIHGFCQAIIRSYAVEADIDPGARVLDGGEAESAFGTVFEQWVRSRLAGPVRPDDPIAALSRDDPRGVVAMLRKLAVFRRDHRTAKPMPADFSGRPDIELADAVAEFGRWAARAPGEPRTATLLGHLEQLAEFFADSFDSTPSFPALWKLAHPPVLLCMRKDSFELLTPRLKTAWQKAAGKEAGPRFCAEAEAHFDRADACYRTLLGRVARNMVAILSDELDEVLAAYDSFKRAVAVLDFDDLLYRACNLVRYHEPVRQALGARYRHILIDEFQDTDPVQAEILFAIAAEERSESWAESRLRPGALFMVGDPKQAIYRFRGADIVSYRLARGAIARRWPDNVIQVNANFRSRSGILAHVNQCFETPLSRDGPPGYVPLTATIDDDAGCLCVVRLPVELAPEPRAHEIREAEAAAVAELCAGLIGRLRIRCGTGEAVPLAPSDIALLAPTGTDLWRYERALERRGLPVASQAGKGLLRRQEFQDLLALTRALADPTDTLAFGAFMRGPFVGLTEEELLNITGTLPSDPDRPDRLPRFSVLTDPEQVTHPVARETLSILRDLRRRARSTSPMLLLSEAIERLMMRPILAARHGDDHARALANLDAFLERARPYSVRGLKRLARNLGAAWAAREASPEGQIDAEDGAIQLVTMHSAKGLEWPVVIPVNTATRRRSPEPFVHRPSDDTLHWIVGEVAPPDLELAMQLDDESLRREQERVLYVACTRARDLLVMTELPGAPMNSWARIVDLRQRALPSVDLAKLPTSALMAPPTEPPNLQTREAFEAEAAEIHRRTTRLTWLRPSDNDADRMPVGEVVALDPGDAPEGELPIGAGRIRGLVLHKLIEEILTGEVEESALVLSSRAATLMARLAPGDGGSLPDKDEIATTALRALRLPGIAELRPALVPEISLFGVIEEGHAVTALSGRADAIALLGGAAAVVVDWKSDVAPTAEDLRLHAGQLRHYLAASGALRGALVYMTPGTVHWIDAVPPTVVSTPSGMANDGSN